MFRLLPSIILENFETIHDFFFLIVMCFTFGAETHLNIFNMTCSCIVKAILKKSYHIYFMSLKGTCYCMYSFEWVKNIWHEPFLLYHLIGFIISKDFLKNAIFHPLIFLNFWPCIKKCKEHFYKKFN